MATLTDDDFTQLTRRANAGILTASDARRLLAEALLEREARKAAEEELAWRRYYHVEDIRTMHYRQQLIGDLQRQLDELRAQRADGIRG